MTSKSRELIDAFSEEVRQIHCSWVLWRRLFAPSMIGEDAEAVQAAHVDAHARMKSASDLCFRHFRTHMLRGVIIDLCRLCDPPRQADRDNLTLCRVLAHMDAAEVNAYCDLARQAMTNVHEIVRNHEGLKGLRNRVLVHFDLETALGVCPVAGEDLENIDFAVREIVVFERAIRAVRSGSSAGSAVENHALTWNTELPWKREADRLINTLRPVARPEPDS